MLVMMLVSDEVADIADELGVVGKVIGVSVEELSKVGLVVGPWLSITGYKRAKIEYFMRLSGLVF